MSKIKYGQFTPLGFLLNGLLIGFILLKVSGVSDMSWGMVLSPIWGPLLMIVGIFILLCAWGLGAFLIRCLWSRLRKEGANG